MADLAFIAILLAFFGLMALFIRGCDRIIGPDEEALTPPVSETSPERTAA